MRIVLDTNVLVSGLLTPFGECGAVVRMATSAEIVLCVDARILLEYSEVLHRPKFDIDSALADLVLDYIRSSSELHSSVPLCTPLPDVDDASFLEVAVSAGAECLVTGNLKHFPKASRSDVRVLSPKQFLACFEERIGG